MSIIALLNLAKDYFVARRTAEALRHLDDSLLNDIGFYRKNGVILPLDAKIKSDAAFEEHLPRQLKERPNDG